MCYYIFLFFASFYSKCFVLTISLRYVGYYILCITILNITINAKWTHSKLWHACLCIFMIICFLIFRTKKTDINFSNYRCSNKINPWCTMTFLTIFVTCFWNVYRWKHQPLLNNSYLAIPVIQVNLSKDYLNISNQNQNMKQSNKLGLVMSIYHKSAWHIRNCVFIVYNKHALLN